ncbi:MAG: S8 family serine peptidase [Blastocatellia bacterium]
MKYKERRFTRLFKAVSFALITLFAVAALSVRSYAQSGDEDFVKGEVVVEIKPGVSIDAINARYGTTTKQRIYGTNIYRLATPKGKKEKKLRKKIAKNDDVLSASLNPVIATPINVFGRAVIDFPGGKPTTGQGRPQYITQQLIANFDEVQRRASGANVIVAVIDTGIDRSHPDIKDHLWTDAGEVPSDQIDNDGDGLVDDVFGWNFLSNNSDTMERPGNPQSSIAGHGTFIAGLIALVAPGARIMPVSAFSTDGVSDAFTVAQGIKYAVDHGARVINLSFGTTEDSVVLHDAVAYAQQRGVLLIAAVGNENKGNDAGPQFPANWNLEVMGVAALDSSNRKAGFSNFGSNVSVSAPGVNLVSLYPETNNTPDYALWSGTSFAAPLATAEAALILEDNPTRQDVRGIIENTATGIDDNNPGFKGKLGKGRIDPLKALQSLDPLAGNGSEMNLIPTGIEPGATGKAEVFISSADQEFEIEAQGLQPNTAYRLFVDGNLINTGTEAVASNYGSFKIEFETSPSGHDHISLPSSLNPVTSIKLVEVRDVQDRIVMANTFGAPQPGGGVSVEKEARLTSTGDAKGKARAEIEPEREKLRVEADKLQAGTVCEIIADGISLGTAVAQGGYFRVEYTSDGSSGLLLPQSLRPVTKIQQIEVRVSGQVVLQGTFQTGGDFGGGDDDGGGGDGGGGGGGSDVQKETSLNSTGIIDDAKGKVKIKSSSSREELEIEGDKLDSGAQYTLVIDGFSLGTVTTDGSGSFKLKLSTEDGNLPSQLRPLTNIQHIEVHDGLGRAVLSGGPPH